MPPRTGALRDKNGSTLIETLLYIFLVAVILSSFLVIIRATFSTQAKFAAHAALNENARFSLRKIESQVKAAAAISSPPAGTTSTRLTITRADPAKNPATLEVINGTLMLTEGAAPQAALTSADIDVTEFIVTHADTTPASIQILFTAQTKSASVAPKTSVTIQETIVIRR